MAYALNRDNNSEDEFKNLLKKSPEWLEYAKKDSKFSYLFYHTESKLNVSNYLDKFTTSIPTEIKEEGNKYNTQIYITWKTEHPSYVNLPYEHQYGKYVSVRVSCKYNRLNPILDGLSNEVEVTYETTKDDLDNKLFNELKIRKEDVNFILPVIKKDLLVGGVRQEKKFNYDEFISFIVKNEKCTKLKYFDKLIIEAKPESKAYFGRNELNIVEHTGYYDIVGLENSEAINEEKSTLDNFADFLDGTNFKEEINTLDKIKSITDIEEVAPNDVVNNRNTIGIIRHELSKGVIVYEKVSWDRVDVRDVITNSVIRENEIYSDFDGEDKLIKIKILDKINKHIKEFIINNKESTGVLKDIRTTFNDVDILPFTGQDDIISSLKNTSSFIVKAKYNSLIYKGFAVINIIFKEAFADAAEIPGFV